MALSDRNLMRLCLALAVSVLFHALLLGMQLSATNDSKAGPASNSLHANLVPAAKPESRREDTLQKTMSRRQNSSARVKTSEPEPSMPDSSAKTGENSAQAIGAALQGMAIQQYMMMRVQQFFSAARENARGIARDRFAQDEMARYQGRRCTLRLLVAPVPGQRYEIVQPECDDPDLAAELQAMPWSTTMPLPSDYSLPYQGLIVYLNLSSYDVSIGLDVIVK